MTIAKTDIKLMASERLTDYYDGGGQMTGSEVIDGEVNNLFPDISRLDRVYGRVSLRKAYPAVITNNMDMYYGSHAIITEPPADDNVHVTLFSTGDFYDERDDAKNRVESYVSIAQELAWRPLNDQLEGQRAITCFAPVGTLAPDISATIGLKNSVTGALQYVRIIDLSSVRTSFVHATYGPYEADVLTIGLSAALQSLFPGIEATPFPTKATTRIHATVVADAASYYGVSRMAQAAATGDLSFWVDSIYNQLVPTSQLETAVIDQLMGGDQSTMIQSGPVDSLTFSGARNQDTNTIYLRRGILPGSLTVSLGGYSYYDQVGSLEAVGADGGFSGSVDYGTGRVTIDRTTSWSYTVTITGTPAAAVAESPYSRETEITLEGRAFNYTPNLQPPPQPGSLLIDYMAQGSWYQLWDNGHGVLISNEDGIGTGTVDYTSGSVVLTVGALPDVGSSLLYHWGSGLHVSERSGEIDGAPVVVQHTLIHNKIKPSSVTITWGDSTATDNGAGKFIGDASGSIAYGSGKLRLIPDTVPASGEPYTVTYEQAPPDQSQTITNQVVNDGVISFTLAVKPIRPGSVHLSFAKKLIKKVEGTKIQYTTADVSFADDAAGGIVYNDTAVGTINYTTGEVSVAGLPHTRYKWYKFLRTFYRGWAGWPAFSYEHGYTLYYPTINTSISCQYSEDKVVTWGSQSETIEAGDVVIDLTPDTAEDVVPGSLTFAVGSSVYYDYLGNIYRDKSSDTGAGTLCGVINYDTGDVTLTNYPQMSTTTITALTLLTRTDQPAGVNLTFRTPGVPVRDGSFSCRGMTVDNTLVTAIATNGGDISDDGIEGNIDGQSGIVRLRFGTMVTAAGNEEEPWYDEDDVVDGEIFAPDGVMPETALYNCVIYSFLPLDADLLGIEPIRLPLDGRVPIFKSGMVAVVHHTTDELLPNPLSAGQTVTLARDALALCDLVDQAGALVDESLYTLDLDAGIVTMANPLDLSAYTQPLVAAHRIEDMVLISEAQINGLIRTVGPLTHNYIAAETQVSSALIFGDLASRIVRSFTQKTWSNVWADARSGDDSTAKYNDLNYPIVLTNTGSIAQRWAIVFTSGSTFNVISENMGVLAAGNTSSDVAIINQFTGVPYFRIDYRGWGTGWAAGNVLRFDTSAANAPMWLARTTMQGAVEEPTDDFVIQIRGDAN